MTEEKREKKGDLISWHNVWDHWIDSKSDEPESDEGDMTVQEDGTVLEEGINEDAASGSKEHYEELWEDLPVEPFGEQQNRSSVVLKADSSEDQVKGLVLKIGGWCQGILKNNRGLTVERWRRQPPNDSMDGTALPVEEEESTRTRNDWVRVFRVGNGTLPCESLCSYTDGRFGYNHPIKDSSDVSWRVIEEYYY